MWDGNIAAVRLEYLFGLTHLCHQRVQDIPDMRVMELAVLVYGIDRWLSARQQGQVTPNGAG